MNADVSTPGLTRRRALALGAGALAASLPATRALAANPTRPADPNLPVTGPALEPEIISVTDTALAAWWRTDMPLDSLVLVEALDGPDKGKTRTVKLDEPRTVHAVCVDGLRPGTRYRYEMRSGGTKVSGGANKEADPGEVRTLVPPKGRFLARIAVFNDLHVGEQCSGTISDTPDGGSFPPCYSLPDYAYKMDDAGLAEVAKLDIDLLVANGDLTDRGRDFEIARSLARLRRAGLELMVTRGNHDRRLDGACAADGDCLRAQAFPTQAVGDSVLRSVKRVGDQVAVVGMDSADPTTGRGRLDLGGQPAWLDEQLTTLRGEGRLVIVAFHHPILAETDPPRISDAVNQGADEIIAVLAKHDHVKLVINGHTHRNNLGFDKGIGQRLPFLENGAMKEYPAGYAVLDVHEDGIMRTFHRPVTPFTREWTLTSSKQVFGNHPNLTRGRLSSRAFVTAYSGDRLATAQSATPSDAGLNVKGPKRVALAKLVKEGVVVEVRGYAGTRARVSVLGRVRVDGRSQTLVLASGKRTGSGKLRLRTDAKTKKLLAAAKPKTIAAVLQVSSSGRVVERSVTVSGGSSPAR